MQKYLNILVTFRAILNNVILMSTYIWPLLGQFWLKIGQLFIPSSGHTGRRRRQWNPFFFFSLLSHSECAQKEFDRCNGTDGFYVVAAQLWIMLHDDHDNNNKAIYDISSGTYISGCIKIRTISTTA